MANSFFNVLTVTTAGTEIQVAPALSYTPIQCLQVIVSANLDNTGRIYLGMGNPTSSSKYFVQLAAGDSFNSGPSGSIPNFPIQDLWMDSSVNGEGAGVLILPGVISQ